MKWNMRISRGQQWMLLKAFELPCFFALNYCASVRLSIDNCEFTKNPKFTYL